MNDKKVSQQSEIPTKVIKMEVDIFFEYFFNPLMHNVPKWLDTLQKSCSKCCKIFKVYLTILGHYALKGK